MLRKSIKYIVASVISFVLSVAFAFVSLVTLPDLRMPSVPEDAASVLDRAQFTYHDCTPTENGETMPIGADPQTVIEGVTGQMQTLCIRLAAPMIPGTYYQLYYAVDGEEFSEPNSISGYSVNGQYDLVFQLEKGNYTMFRLDVGGSYHLSDILTSNVQARIVSVDRVEQLLSGNISVLNGRQWVIIFAALWVQAMLIVWQRKRIKGWFGKRAEQYRHDAVGFWLGVTRFLVGVVIALVTWAVLGFFGVVIPGFYSLVYFSLAGCVLGGVLAFWKQTAEHPERLLTVLILCVGFTLALLMPRTAMVSWDDETHYRRALDLSYCSESWYTGADSMMYPMLLSNEMSLNTAHEVTTQLNDLYEQGAAGSRTVNVFNLSYLAYLPSAAGMWLARAVGLSFTGIFLAGRIGNVIFYAAVLYFAMKRLKGNNLLIGLFALIPTMIFIAANYSYDTWCLSFLALGTAVFLDEYRHPEREFSWPSACLMLGALILGCIPKAIYFPIFLMGLFMPRAKFRTRRQMWLYRLVVVLCAMAMALSFAAPFLFTGGAGEGFTDSRGGSDVSGSGQLAYILNDPINYAVILLRFLCTSYFVPGNVINSTVVFFAYMGSVAYAMGFVVLLLVVFLAERERQAAALPQPGLLAKGAAILSFFCAVCLAATAMYVAYTPVGYHTINGCQWRYMMPVLLPVLMQIRPNRTWMPIPRRWFNLIVIVLEAGLLFAGMWPYMASYV